MTEKMFGISIVSKKTGLSAHAIRAWEKRYSAVTPIRTQTNRRLYTQSHIARLANLKTLCDSGHTISNIANLTDLELMELIEQSPKSESRSKDIIYTNNEATNYVKDSIDSILNYNSSKLQQIFTKAHIELGNIGFINKLLVPLMEQIGELWREGNLRIAHEHLTSNLIRTFIGNLINSSTAYGSSQTIVVTTPFGQIHELGSILVACTAATEGWNVKYLGANLPSEEIAAAAVANNANVVALSVVYPNFDSSVLEELKRLTTLLPDNITIFIGGRAAPNYKPFLLNENIRFIDSLMELRKNLESLICIDIATN